ncbi:MAG: hypothetical protein JWM57_413 [Phycisphaerales bacterium]|nr:hypothetical protein [Phycisphaerales bacterium]
MTRPIARTFGVGVAVVLMTAGAASADGGDPKAVFKQYADALAAGDIDRVKQLIIADEKRLPVIEGRRAAAVAEKQFQAAVEKAFPGALKPVEYTGPTTRPIDAPDPDRLTVTQDTATLISRDTLEPIRFKRVGEEWKIDLNAMYPPQTVSEIETFRGALVEVMNALSTEIAAGRFKNYAEVQTDLETRVKMRIANPDQPATTRPK